MLYGAPNDPMYWEFFGILRIQSGNPGEPSGENVEVSVMSCSVESMSTNNKAMFPSITLW
jgi:hypothetical protein